MVMQTTLWCKGRWQHKADRRVYTNFQQLAGVPLWEKIKVPALVIKGEHSKRFGPEVLAEIRARARRCRRPIITSRWKIPGDLWMSCGTS